MSMLSKFKSAFLILFLIIIAFNINIYSLHNTSLKCTLPKSKFLWNAEKISLINIIKQISKLTCKNYIIPIRLEKTTNISIILQDPINMLDAESIFINVLKTHGLIRFKSKEQNYYSIINVNNATLNTFNNIYFFKSQKSSIFEDSTNTEYQSTIIYSSKNININVIYNLIKVLISKLGNVNCLNKKYVIIRDKTSQVKLILKALRNINKLEHIYILHFQTQNICGKLMQKIINKLYVLGFFNHYIYHKNNIYEFNSYKNKIKHNHNKLKCISKIIIFYNKNICFLRGNKKFLNKLRVLIHHIDNSLIPIKKNIIKVFSICDSNAKDIIKVLHDIFINNNNFQYYKHLYISICEKNNSIIICSSVSSLKVIGKLIKKIQNQRKQIHIEASILDISITSSNENHWDFINIFNYKGKNSIYKNLSFFFANSNGQKLIKKHNFSTRNRPKQDTISSKDNIKFISDLVGNFGLNIPKIRITNQLFINDFISLFKSHETCSDIKIIASPSLTTVNHKKAEISVGEKIPTIGSLSGQTSRHDTSSLSIPHVKYEDISLKFIATPHIKDNNIIYIDIEQENNEIGENIPLYNNFTQSSIKTKRIKTSICIMNKQTIVIGGLVNEKTIKTKKNIPILSDMPFIKHFCQNQNNMKRKSSLVLLITPTIINTNSSLIKKYKIDKIKQIVNQ